MSDSGQAGGGGVEDGPDQDLRGAIIQAAMDIAADGGWRRADMASIAEAAGLDNETVTRNFRSKIAILEGLARRVDGEVDEQADADLKDPAIPVRERLFEVLMLRFDALRPYQSGIRALVKALAADPCMALAGGPSLARSMTASVRAVGLETRSPFGLLRVKGLGMVFLSVLLVWIDDDNPDLAATMKALDTRLRQVDELARSFGMDRRGSRQAEETA